MFVVDEKGESIAMCPHFAAQMTRVKVKKAVKPHNTCQTYIILG